MKENVLIFGGGGYNALQVYFALKDTVRYYPILASSADNHSTFVSNDAIINLPYDSSPDFIDELNRYIVENNVKYIIPTHDTAALRLMENEKNIGAVVICSPLNTTRICRYKSLTYDILKEYDFVPKTYKKDSEELEFPLFAKDDVGQGGKNAIRVNDVNELQLLDENIHFVLCEYLPGNEITIDCFTDRNGQLRYVQPRTRSRLLNGISARSTTIHLTEEMEGIIKKISLKIKFRGYWFVQLKQDKFGRYKLMEVSTRFAGTFAVSKNLDVNLPLLALADFSGRDIEIYPNNYTITADKTYIDRYMIDYEYERVYIDFDDTIVFNREKYNVEAMRFLYQCLNQKKKLVLITKHAFNLKETANRIRLNLEIFDEIIEVSEADSKYLYMNNDVPSIFIDNSFAERKSVKKHLGMPTFDITNIEALIDWR